MPKSTKQKYRLLEIVRILKEETDIDHPITTQEFCSRLGQEGITCDRRTLSADISELTGLGYEIADTKIGKHKAYFYDDFLFSVDELKVLIDAVQASAFIPEKRTKRLMDKLASLGGYHREEVLKGNMVTFNTRKHSNEAIMYNVGLINEAIDHNKKISFRYFDLDENHEKKYRKDKERYTECPIALVYNEDNYYVICYSEKYRTSVNYRVDRMDYITISKEDVPQEAGRIRKGLPEYTRQSFKMFGGEPETITIRFDDSLIGPVYDKFGEDIEMTRISADTCETTVTVQISPAFWGWLMQFGHRLTIVSPAGLGKELIGKLSEIEENYRS